MPGKLLILTYHGPGVLTGEDLRFKEAAIQSTLVSGDAMDEVGQNNDGPKPFFDAHADDLLNPRKATFPSGVDVVKRGNTPLITFNHLGQHTWERPGYVLKPVLGDATRHLRSLFEQWLLKVFAAPIDVLVLAGHHSNSIVWGSEESTTPPYRPFSALKPFETNSGFELLMRGFSSDGRRGDFLRAGPFDMTQTFSTCRLLVVFGCNGATDQIKAWRECIRKARAGAPPFILGFRGVHSFPRDADGEFVSPLLWPGLKGLAPGSPGNQNLAFLDDPAMAERIGDVWFTALKTAFGTASKRRHLYFSTRDSKGRRGPRGAGYIDTQGNIIWIDREDGHVTSGGHLP